METNIRTAQERSERRKKRMIGYGKNREETVRNKIKQGIRMLFVLAGITYMVSGCGFAEQAELLKNELSKAGIESGKPKEPQKKKKKKKNKKKKTPAK